MKANEEIEALSIKQRKIETKLDELKEAQANKEKLIKDKKQNVEQASLKMREKE